MQHPKHNNLILVVGELIQELKLLGNHLADLGEVIFATSVASAIEMTEARHPDIVVCLGPLQATTTAATCRKIKESGGQDATVVIVDFHSAIHELEAFEAGAIDFIGSPYNPLVLQARIRTHLEVSRKTSVLQSLAEKDGLTDVYNRRYFENQLQTELKRHYRQQQSLTLALLDIDHFKLYNDTFGHLQGDICIREVAQAIYSASRRPGEFVARYGGEEFVAVLPNTNLHNAKKYGRWICTRAMQLAIPHTFSKTAPFVTVSVGIVAIIPQIHTTADSIVAAADSALYLAKESGRNQFKIATMHQTTIKEVG